MVRKIDTPAKDRLLASGAVLFSEKGFEGVSVREICKHANTSMSMIHHYFENKEGLLKAIIEQFGDHVFSIQMRILDKAPRSEEDFLVRFEMLFESTLEAIIENRLVLMIVNREQVIPKCVKEYHSRFSEFLEQAKKRGFVRKELDSNMITGFLMDRINSQVLSAPLLKKTYGKNVLSDPEYKKRWCQSNLDLFINGIRPLKKVKV